MTKTLISARTPLPREGGPRADGHIRPSRKASWVRRFPLLPALIVALVVTQIPFLFTIVNSLQEWVLLRPNQRQFIGFGNYVSVLTDPAFLSAALNSAVMTTAAVVGSLLFGLVLALLLDRRFRGRAFARTLLIAPFLVMPAASALVWKTSLLDPTNGILNWLLTPFGGGGIEWASRLPMLSIVMFLIWQWTPFMMLLLLAGLQSQDTDIIEAARVDGAGAGTIFASLTLPHLRPYIELSVLLGCIYIVQTFDPVFLITQGGPGNATTNLPYYLYLQAFRAGDIGVASAAGVLVVIAANVIATLALRLLSSVFKVGAR